MLFDALKGSTAPATDLGLLLDGSATVHAAEKLQAIARTAAERVNGTFGVVLSAPGSAHKLDELVASMWNDGWSPEHGNLRLFASDFGAAFAVALLELPGAIPCFRSERDLRDFSVWFDRGRAEYFPFHKAVKALSTSGGESFTQMYRDAERASIGG